jgi:hypothetical protein
MERHDAPSIIAALTAAAAVQTEASGQHLLFERGQVVLRRLHSVWRQLEVHEAMVYWDNVAAQVRTLEEATRSLWSLHRVLVATRRQLQRHQRDLQRCAHGSKGLQPGHRSRMPGSRPKRHSESRRGLGDSPLPSF